MEEREEVKPVIVRYKCSKCNEGYMQRTDTVLTSNPPQFPHTCSKCGYNEIFLIMYPHLEYNGEKTISLP